MADIPAEPPAIDRRLVIAATVFATAGLGVPYSSGFVQMSRLTLNPLADNTVAEHLVLYSAAAALIVALLVLRQFPVRGWAWLLTAGAVLTLPLPLSIMDRDLFDNAPSALITTPIVAGNILAVIGVLGAAAWISTKSANMGTALGATSVVVPTLGTFTLFAILFGLSRDQGSWVFITLSVVALLGSIGALVVSSYVKEDEPARPGWRLIACGAFAALLPVITFWLNHDDRERSFLLVVGLIMVVPALLAALVAGWRIMLAALVVGMIAAAAAQASLYGFAFRAMEVPTWILLLVLLIGLASGWLLATSRWRAWTGFAGLTICALAVLMTDSYKTFESPRPSGSETTLAVVVLMIGIVAATSAIASVIGSLTEPPHLPAVAGAFAFTIQSGIATFLAYIARPEATPSNQEGRAVTISGIALLLAAGAVAALAMWQLRRTPPPLAEPDQSSSVTSSVPSA